MAAVQATRPEPDFPPPQPTHQYPPQQQLHAQTQSYQPSLSQPSIDHQATIPSYFPTIGTLEEKPGVQATVHEYAMTPVSPPISSPSTPAPVYMQPYGVPPPMPMVIQCHTIVDAQEVDATSMPHALNQTGPVHEIGAGK
ncbi:hypothetical protein E8E11_008694 [Didymella keratinophila]|nr:hypothetical protein E8E11_008694 [Didymella keratinophila]